MIRVLHIMGCSEVGGISTVVLNYYRFIDRTQIQFDIALTVPHVGRNALALQELGAKIHFLPLKSEGIGAFQQALRELLEKERAHVDNLIICIHELLEKGVTPYMFDALDRTKMEAYKKEAMEKWGETAAWQEYASRKVTPDQHQQAAKEMMVMFGEMGALKDLPPESAEAQEKVKALQQFITDNFYTCTKEILYSLGQMYTQYDRFRQSIDSVGGEGTAAFVQKAIEIYCK